MNKAQLRKWAKETRSELNIEDLSSVLIKKLQQTEEYKNAKNIMIFYPLKDEINLLDLLEDQTKVFYLPKIDGKNLLCCKFNKNTTLCESCYHTKEPIDTATGIPDLVIIPALAVDKKNYRLGYGGGFYDRYLANINTKKVICIPKKLIVETIYPDKYDISADLIITA